jgi:hypothetical protein
MHGRTMEWRLVDAGGGRDVGAGVAMGSGANAGTGGAAAPHAPIVETRFPATPGLEPDPLYGVLPLRTTDRGPYRRRPLCARERAALQAALDPGLQLRWYESGRERRRFARLSALATRIRLRLPAAFDVHRRIIDWAPGDSATGIPAGATGLWRPTLPLMRWAMRDWRRMAWLNRLGGARSAALQLDWGPALACAGFFTIALPPDGSREPESLLQICGSLLRFWLVATRLGLALQPGLAMLMFAHYGATAAPFTRDARLRHEALQCHRQLRGLVGDDEVERLVFVGRVGEPRDARPRQRSVRLGVPELLLPENDSPA